MKFNINRFFVASLAIFGFAQAAHAACNATLNPGSDVVAAVNSATAGTTVCLNPGNYGAQAFTKIVKSADVVIQSSSGNGATLSIDTWASQHLKFQNLTISGATVRDASTYVSFVGSTFTGQALVNVTGSNVHVLFDTSTFDGITVCADCYEGRLQIVSGSGVTVTNSHFGGAGESDGIQIGASGAIIGPGNVFEGLVQGNYGRHIDSIQGYGQSNTTITGNYFTNDTIYVGFYDGGSNETITNNVFGPSTTNEQKLQLGSVQGLTFTHNTVKGNFVVAQGAKSGSARNSNATYTNNVFDGTSIADTGDQPGCATNCVYQSNLFTSSSNARGTVNVIGKPTYAAGASPTTWGGFALTSASPGYHAASDGRDLGINSTATATVALVPAPTSLRVN